uniref:MBD domain-containing protein n=1 Tax=Trichuris muris TaxID=70415 RepID=A0A5S6R0L8_TRIMR
MSAAESDSEDLDRSVREVLKQSTSPRKVRTALASTESAVPSTSTAAVILSHSSGRRRREAVKSGRKPYSKEADYLKPLEKGWVREMVRRTVVSKSAAADIYYTSPDGIKFRSGKEIERFFKANPEKAAGLRSDYFTFKRVLLGWNGPEEFVRKAGSIGYPGHKKVGRRLSAKSTKI